MILKYLLFCQHTLFRKNITTILLEKKSMFIFNCHSIFNKNHIQYIFRILPEVLVGTILVKDWSYIH